MLHGVSSQLGSNPMKHAHPTTGKVNDPSVGLPLCMVISWAQMPGLGLMSI